MDFAGGIVIHTTAGVSSLMVAIILGPRIGFEPGLQLSIKDDDVENTKGGCCKIKYAKPEVVPKTEVEELQAENESKPHDIPLATIGAAMLWMGWFGFNAGSALTSGAGAGHTLLTTHIGACTCGKTPPPTPPRHPPTHTKQTHTHTQICTHVTTLLHLDARGGGRGF